MTRHRKWSPVVGGLLVTLIAGTVVWRHLAPEMAPPATESTASTSSFNQRSLPSLPVAEPAPALAEPQEPIAARVARLMEDWHSAIVNKNADSVQALDSAFAAHPHDFIPALMASAEGDPEERVRAFSTRVLGKLRSAESTELMRKLLADRSEYVRFNAAWALGELSDREAMSRLRRLQKADPSAMVRRSAEDSVRRLEGG